MSTNKYRPHVHILPEDAANRQIANGFLLNPLLDLDQRAVQVLRPAGGWGKVLQEFKEVHIPEMKKNSHRRIVLLIDFDDKLDRFCKITSEIPTDLRDRAFILGARSTPEKLKTAFGKTFEGIGSSIARDCAEETRTVWSHDLLKHNKTELDRMDSVVPPVRTILFKGSFQK
jgi:hypothetical protein